VVCGIIKIGSIADKCKRMVDKIKIKIISSALVKIQVFELIFYLIFNKIIKKKVKVTPIMVKVTLKEKKHCLNVII